MSDEDSELKLRSFEIHQPAPKALQEIMNSLQSAGTEVFYAIRSRVKSVKAIQEKTLRKRSDGKTGYKPDDITDIVGIRIVTLFREDIISALKIFLGMIRHQVPNSPFVKDELKEGLIYTNATAGDPEAITSRLRSVFESFDFPIKDSNIMQMKTGYSSIHLVAFCCVKQDEDMVSVPIEIQIRTVFEDAWGEIDHKLRYSINRNQSAPDRMLESWQPHLNVLKTFADGCSQYAGIIKAQAIDVEAIPGTYLIVPVDDPKDALKGIGKSAPRLKAAFKDAYAGREAAMRLAASGPAAEAEQMFFEAADAFSAAGDLIATSTQSEKEREVAVFLSKMERAFCLLSIGKKETLGEAIRLYSEVQELLPNSVVVYYRYAQALSKLNELDSAIAKYEKAESLLSTDDFVPRNHWLHTVIPRMLGFALWKKSRSLPNTENDRAERVRLLVAAYQYNKKACQSGELNKTSTTLLSSLRNANNALHYAVEYVDLTGGGTEIRKEEVAEHLAFLEKNLDLATAVKQQLNFVDTLCRASVLFGKINQAVLAAEKIEHLLSTPPEKATAAVQLPTEDDATPKGASPPSPTGASYYATTSHLNELERDMLDHALWVLRRHGPGPERK